MQIIDLFSGCGGMSLGFENAGYIVRAAFDNWKPAIEVYQSNFEHPIIDYNLGDFAGNVSIFNQFDPDMIIGGPPCQDFSSAGKRDETLGRADLTISFANRACCRIKCCQYTPSFLPKSLTLIAKSGSLLL